MPRHGRSSCSDPNSVPHGPGKLDCDDWIGIVVGIDDERLLTVRNDSSGWKMPKTWNFFENDRTTHDATHIRTFLTSISPKTVSFSFKWYPYPYSGQQSWYNGTGFKPVPSRRPPNRIVKLLGSFGRDAGMGDVLQPTANQSHQRKNSCVSGVR